MNGLFLDKQFAYRVRLVSFLYDPVLKLFSFCSFQRLIYMEAERVRKEEEARLRKKLGAKKAAEAAEKLAQVSFKIFVTVCLHKVLNNVKK